MARIVLSEQLIEVPCEVGAYYKTSVMLHAGTELKGNATIPEHGRVTVQKEIIQYPNMHTSFSWKIIK